MTAIDIIRTGVPLIVSNKASPIYQRTRSSTSADKNSAASVTELLSLPTLPRHAETSELPYDAPDKNVRRSRSGSRRRKAVFTKPGSKAQGSEKRKVQRLKSAAGKQISCQCEDKVNSQHNDAEAISHDSVLAPDIAEQEGSFRVTGTLVDHSSVAPAQVYAAAETDLSTSVLQCSNSCASAKLSESVSNSLPRSPRSETNTERSHDMPAEEVVRSKSRSKRRAMFTKRDSKAQRSEKRQLKQFKSAARTLSACLDDIRSQRIDDEAMDQDSLESIDVTDPSGVSSHLTLQELRAMRGVNILQSIANDSSDCFLKKVQKLLVEGVHRNLRDALDLAGKIPFSIKMLSLNVSYKKLLIDFSQASAEAIYKQSLLQFFGKKNVLPLIFLLF